ncbi:hypothetical protein BMS3Bbin16_00344 [archaeon BMS3Bbin16]|nr:hypothetical protein BMS3Bbin16_00344 [archaeon BMS3Bbin16]
MGLIDDFIEDLKGTPLSHFKTKIKNLNTGRKEKRFWKELKDILRESIRAPFFEVTDTVISLTASGEEKGFWKGDDFELYVTDLFPSDRFVLCETPPRPLPDNRYIEANMRPDFKFRDRRTSAEFWVECKYRGRLTKDKKIIWCSSKQFKRYSEFKKKTGKKIFIVIGFSGKAYKPKKLYCFNLDELKFQDVYEKEIEKFERLPKKPFTYEKRRLI